VLSLWCQMQCHLYCLLSSIFWSHMCPYVVYSVSVVLDNKPSAQGGTLGRHGRLNDGEWLIKALPVVMP
jgi:hypothetical protein